MTESNQMLPIISISKSLHVQNKIHSSTGHPLNLTHFTRTTWDQTMNENKAKESIVLLSPCKEKEKKEENSDQDNK
jgi:hypothetical protein